MTDRTFFKGLTTLFIVIMIGIIGVGYYCNTKVIPVTIQIMKDEMAKIEKYDRCINGFVYRKHLSADLYYEYRDNGQPVKCVKP